jgi:hypothetical protein
MTARQFHSEEDAMTIYIAPNCSAEVDAMIRRQAAKTGEQVMPARPFPWNRLATDQRVVAERKWLAPIKPAKPQQPCDHGLFSDEMDQVEMFLDPTNGD